MAVTVEKTTYPALAEKLAEVRAARNLSQEELAKLCGMSQPAIARLEAGEHEPRLDTLRKVAHALGGELVIKVEFNARRKAELARL